MTFFSKLRRKLRRGAVLLWALSAFGPSAAFAQYSILDTIITIQPDGYLWEDGKQSQYPVILPDLPRIWKNNDFDLTQGYVYTAVEVLEKPASGQISLSLGIVQYWENYLECTRDAYCARRFPGTFGGTSTFGNKPYNFDIEVYKKLKRIQLRTKPLVLQDTCTYYAFEPAAGMAGMDQIQSKEFLNPYASVFVLAGNAAGDPFIPDLGYGGAAPSNPASVLPVKVRVVSFMVPKGGTFVPPDNWPENKCVSTQQPVICAEN